MTNSPDVQDFLVRLQKEKAVQAEQVGGKLLSQHNAMAQARGVRDYVQGLARLPVADGNPLPLEASIQMGGEHHPDELKVWVELAGSAICSFWITRNRLGPYHLLGSAYLSYGRALRKLGHYIARKEAARQLLTQRAQPLFDLLSAFAAKRKLEFSTRYYGDVGWAVKDDHADGILRDAGHREIVRLLVFADRFEWDVRDRGVVKNLFLAEADMVRFLQSETEQMERRWK